MSQRQWHWTSAKKYAPHLALPKKDVLRCFEMKEKIVGRFQKLQQVRKLKSSNKKHTFKFRLLLQVLSLILNYQTIWQIYPSHGSQCKSCQPLPKNQDVLDNKTSPKLTNNSTKFTKHLLFCGDPFFKNDLQETTLVQAPRAQTSTDW